MSSTLIGLVDQKISSSNVSWDVNKIGGNPSWLDDTSEHKVPLCGVCCQPCGLITQLYCPLWGSSYHRCIYVFACLSPCSRNPEGWAVLRGQKLNMSFTTEPQGVMDKDEWESETDPWLEGQDDWGQEDDDWGESSNKEVDVAIIKDNINATSDIDKSSSEYSLTQDMNTKAFSQFNISEDKSTDKLLENEVSQYQPGECRGDGIQLMEEPLMLVQDESRLNAVAALLNTKTPDASACLPLSISAPTPSMLKPFYLYVIEEPVDTYREDSDHLAKLIRSYEEAEGTTLDKIVSAGSKLGGKGSSKETYEKAELKHGDKVFHKFMKRMQRCPEQCVRYERNGNPVLVKPLDSSDATKLLACERCGGKRVFELQLLPPLIGSLKFDDDSQSSVEFGSVLIYTCENSCNDNESSDFDMVSEIVIYQADPDEHLYTSINS